MVQKLTEMVTQMLVHIGIPTTTISVVCTGENAYKVDISSEDSALLIWLHGQHLSALRHILARAADRLAGVHTDISLDIDGYLVARDTKLYTLLDARISYAVRTGLPTPVNGLDSFDRRKAHEYISTKNVTGIRTESTGDGDARTLQIYYTTPKVHTIITPSTTKAHTNHDVDISLDGVGI